MQVNVFAYATRLPCRSNEVFACESCASAQRQDVAGRQGAGVRGAGDHERRCGLGLHSERRGTRRGRKELLQFGRPGVPARVDPVETLGVAAGVVVDLEPAARGRAQRVRHAARRHRLLQQGRRFEAVARKLEVVIAQRHLPGDDVLRLFPRIDAFAGSLQLAVGVEADRVERRVSRQPVDEHELVAVGALLEEVVDPLLLQQPREEVEVGLIVLDDVRARLEAAL